jgi:hypothetical protein
MTGGRFIVLRDCIGPGGVRLCKNTVVELDDAQFIGDMLAAHKLAAADKPTEARIRWHTGAAWTKGEPRELLPERDPWIRRSAA